MIIQPSSTPESKEPPAPASAEREPEPAVQRDDQESQAVSRAEAVPEDEQEANLTSTPDKAPCGLAPLQLSQLRTKNADSFDMEEVRADSHRRDASYRLRSFRHAFLRPLGRVNSFFPESQPCVIFTDVAPFLKNTSVFAPVFKHFIIIFIYFVHLNFAHLCIFSFRFKVMKTRLYHTNPLELAVSTNSFSKLAASILLRNF